MNQPLLESTLFVALAALACVSPCAADDSAAKGLAIAEEADRRNDNYGDSATTFRMVLRNKQGQESTRAIRLKTLEMRADGDKSLVIFDRPRDVAGTALLTYTHKHDPDDRWLYLPAVKRVKRIASSNQSGPFMGSEFAYEDIGSQEVEKYSYRWLRDETLQGMTCHVIERVPRDPESGYTRQLVWLDQADYRALQIEFYDRKQSLLKTLSLHDYRRYLDRYWRAHRLEMANHQTGKGTILLFTDYQFRVGLTERDLDQNSLASAR